MRPAFALPCDGHVKRRYFYAPSFTPEAAQSRACGGPRACDRPGGARDPGSEPAFAVRGISVRFRPFQRQSFGDLTREQRLARLDALAKLLDVAFILPGTKIRYGIDGLIGLIPMVGDIITTAISLWLVREARALGAPWHITARMLANVAVEAWSAWCRSRATPSTSCSAPMSERADAASDGWTSSRAFKRAKT